jgi:hypothetical protein
LSDQLLTGPKSHLDVGSWASGYASPTPSCVGGIDKTDIEHAFDQTRS